MSNTIDFEFGETVASNAFWDRNPAFWPSFERLMALTNKCFGRQWNDQNIMELIGYKLGETCRQDFLEIAFLAVNGHGIGAQKLLRGLYERAVTLEYLRQNPVKADRFAKYGAIQDHKLARAAVELVGEQEFDDVMPTPFKDIKKAFDEVKPEFQNTDCKTCDTKRPAISWDIDIASMVHKIGGPYKQFYLAAYMMPTLHIHATLASAFAKEAVRETPTERNIHEAEFSLACATFLFIAVMRSQNEIFKLTLDEEIDTCWRDVTEVWKDHRHDPLASTATSAAGVTAI